MKAFSPRNNILTRIIAGVLVLAVWLADSAGAATPDVVVYSGVPCGIAAAIMAAREGAKVVLVDADTGVILASGTALTGPRLEKTLAQALAGRKRQ